MADGFLQSLSRWKRQVSREKDLTLTAARVALALSCYFNSETGDAFPSAKLLAAETGIDRRNVQKALARLVELGHLSMTPGNGRKNPNRYAFILMERKSVSGDALSNCQKSVSGDAVSDDEKERLWGRKKSVSGDALTEKNREGSAGAGPWAGPLPPSPVATVEPYDQTSPFDHRAHKRHRMKQQTRAGANSPARSSRRNLSQSQLDDVFGQMWSAWMWEDTEIEARKAFDEAIEITHPDDLLTAFERGGTVEQENFSLTIYELVDRLRRAA